MEGRWIDDGNGAWHQLSYEDMMRREWVAACSRSWTHESLTDAVSETLATPPFGAQVCPTCLRAAGKEKRNGK